MAFFVGLVVVSKAACAGGVATGALSLLWQASDACIGGEVRLTKQERSRRLRRKQSIEINKNQQHKWVSHLGNIEAKSVLQAFCGGVVAGTVGGALWTGAHGVATTAIPLTKEPWITVIELVGAGLVLWTPTFVLLTRTNQEIEHGVPFYFFDGMVLGTAWFSATSLFGFRSLSKMGLCTTSGFTALMLLVFVTKYGYYQSSKRVLYTGPITTISHKWLITAGVVSGTFLSVALAVTPFYHPGQFLVWGITNPALMYTMCVAAEQEIECEQMGNYRKTVNEDYLQQRRFIRALLPMAGLPFGYVADRDDVSKAVKVGLAGIGALALGANIFLFHDEWNAFIIDEANYVPPMDAIPFVPSEDEQDEDEKKETPQQ